MLNCIFDCYSGVYGHTIGEVPWEAADFCVDEQVATIVGKYYLSQRGQLINQGSC